MPSRPHIVLLVGPKGVGKSTLGRLLAATYGFAHVEPEMLFLEHAASRSSYTDASAWERDGYLAVVRAVSEASASHAVVVTNTTGASTQLSTLVDGLRACGTVGVVRLTASESTCRARIDRRDPSVQLPTDPALVSRMYARSAAAPISADVTVESVELPSPLLALPRLREALRALGIAAVARTPRLHTERTVLREWTPDDLDALAALNANPLVAEHLAGGTSRHDAEEMLRVVLDGFATYGFGPWAIELPGRRSFAGFTGLWVPRFDAAFTPCVEMAWRLAANEWGRGLVTEVATAVIDHAFGALALNELVAFTSPHNSRSRAVMHRLGMRRDSDGDFEHPRVPDGHRLKRHVLYRLPRADWHAAQPSASDELSPS